ncbi:MAG: DUF3102 domain-containing protein [Treponema sp.]|jgi:hypothetical protein|nr:DUF3102 domain-containing protein [Treponema sp.]
MEQPGNTDFGLKEFAAAHPELADGAAEYIAKNPDGFSPGAVEKAKARTAGKKYKGLFSCPASDGNFTSAIRRLGDGELEDFKCELITRDLDEHCHKGRLDAVAKEIRRRGSASVEIIAVDNMAEDIVTADNRYGDGMPYDIDRMENEIRFYQDQAGTALLEMGKRLIRIKAHEGHGKFLESLGRLGLAERSAQYAMLAARKFSNTPTLAHLDSSKIKALTVLDEDDIKTLESGGEVKGMNLDDVDRMSTRELRENLRKEKELAKKEKEARKKERAVFEQSMSQKDGKINELDMRLAGQEPPTEEQLARAAVQRFRDPIIDNILEATERMGRAIAAIDEAQKVPRVPFEALEELLDPWKESFNTFCAAAADLTDAFNNIHVDKGRG